MTNPKPTINKAPFSWRGERPKFSSRVIVTNVSLIVEWYKSKASRKVFDSARYKQKYKTNNQKLQ
jgi:aminoglycoside/choline kinase family phosphotransferase